MPTNWDPEVNTPPPELVTAELTWEGILGGGNIVEVLVGELACNDVMEAEGGELICVKKKWKEQKKRTKYNIYKTKATKKLQQK